MSVSVTRGSVGAFETIELTNSRLRAVIIPTLGARVWELEDLARARQWIWHRPDVLLAAAPLGAPYDDVWAGGWEELFPNDAQCSFEGRSLPDHGEWWTTAWKVDHVSAASVGRVRMSASFSVIRVSCVKELELAPDSATLSVHYRIRSDEPRGFWFLFKQHLPVAVTRDCRLALPGGTVCAVDPSFGSVVTTAKPFAWPTLRHDGKSVDLRTMPDPTTERREFLYVRDLPKPWCGVDDPGRDASIRMSFDGRQLPFVWLFLTYGGWRGLHTAVLEPCSNMPKDLAQAARLGHAARLEPGAEFETRVAVTLGDCPEARS
jgi:hypothetical protein